MNPRAALASGLLLTVALGVALGGTVAGASSCDAPATATTLAGRSTATGQLTTGQSDFYSFTTDRNEIAATVATVGGNVQIWIYEDCAHWSCGFYGGLDYLSLGGGGCWGGSFEPHVLEVRAASTLPGASVTYALHFDDCTAPSLNSVCVFMP